MPLRCYQQTASLNGRRYFSLLSILLLLIIYLLMVLTVQKYIELPYNANFWDKWYTFVTDGLVVSANICIFAAFYCNGKGLKRE